MDQKAVKCLIADSNGIWNALAQATVNDAAFQFPQALPVQSYAMVFNGATWDRANSLASNSDGQAAAQIGLGGVVSRSQLFNGTTWDRALSQGNSADAIATSTLGVQKLAAFGFAFNGTTFDRLRNNSAANISATTQPTKLGVADPGEWSITSAPAAATQATVTKGAGAAGVRHVIRSLHFDLCAVAAQAAPVVCVIRDGATGTGTILWQGRLIAPLGACITLDLSGLNIFGTAATAMTIETTAAPAATNFVTCSLSGYSTV